MTKKRIVEEQIEELARMIKRGFTETASKRDLEEIATKQQLQLVADNLDLMKADIHDMKLTLGPLFARALRPNAALMNLKSASSG